MSIFLSVGKGRSEIISSFGKLSEMNITKSSIKLKYLMGISLYNAPINY